MDHQKQTVRLVSLDATRATEQAALVAALLSGRREMMKAKKQDATARQMEQIAGAWLLAWLGQTSCNGRVMSGRRARRVGVTRSTRQRMDFLACGLEGCRDHLTGLDAGSMTYLAGGPPECFLTSDEVARLPKWYHVWALSPRASRDAVLGARISGGPTTQIHEAFNWQKLTKAIAGPNRKGSPVTIGSMAWGQLDPLRSVLSRYARVRAYHGSRVGGALAAFFSAGIDAFSCVANLRQVQVLATAAIATRGHLIAFPSGRSRTRPQKHKEHELYLPGDSEPREAASFLGNKDVFFLCTGVTESVVIRGVRFMPGVAETQTAVMRTLNQSTRFMRHRFALNNHRFRSPSGDSLTYAQLVAAVDSGDFRASNPINEAVAESMLNGAADADDETFPPFED